MPHKTRKKTAKTIFFRIMFVLSQSLWILSMAGLILFLIPLVIPYLDSPLSFQYIERAMEFDNTVSSFVQSVIPTVVFKKDLTRWIIVVAAFLLCSFFLNFRDVFKHKLAQIKTKKEYKDWLSTGRIHEDATLLAYLKTRIADLTIENVKDRKELLQLYSVLNKKLDVIGRNLSFLSIDLIDRTLKDETINNSELEQDMMKYREFIENKLESHCVLQYSWTPDGIISCFSTVDAAWRAASAVIRGLEPFNKFVKATAGNFEVRCGINAGYIHFDSSFPIEKMNEPVIRLATDMQKHAPPNSIFIAKPAVKPFHEPTDFIPTSRVIDGHEVFFWNNN